jgi:arsenical-resistance protein
MALGLSLGALVPGLPVLLDRLRLGTVSLPIALGLLLMMYPVLARVKYEELRHIGGAWRLFGVSLRLNWVIGPILMFALAWLFLPDHPDYRTGLMLVGVARCIAMVLIWNGLAGGSGEHAAVLVALNSVFQVATYALYAWLFLAVFPVWLGLGAAQQVHIGFGAIATSVLVFLGIPLATGGISRVVGVRARGRDWYDGVAMPRIAPAALVALLFTIVVMFALQGRAILCAAGRRAARGHAAGGLLRDHVRRRLLVGLARGVPLRADDHPRLHGGGEQFRAGDRHGGRDLRHHKRAGAGRRHRAADRGARARRPGLCGTLARAAAQLRADRDRAAHLRQPLSAGASIAPHRLVPRATYDEERQGATTMADTPASTQDTPIACGLTTPEWRVREQVLQREIVGGIRETRELPDGYALRFPGETIWPSTLAEFIRFERVLPLLHLRVALRTAARPAMAAPARVGRGQSVRHYAARAQCFLTRIRPKAAGNALPRTREKTAAPR